MKKIRNVCALLWHFYLLVFVKGLVGWNFLFNDSPRYHDPQIWVNNLILSLGWMHTNIICIWRNPVFSRKTKLNNIVREGNDSVLCFFLLQVVIVFLALVSSLFGVLTALFHSVYDVQALPEWTNESIARVNESLLKDIMTSDTYKDARNVSACQKQEFAATNFHE